jgi:hypothetical protein
MDNQITPQDNFMAPMLPAMFSSAMPTQTPQMQWGSGVVNDWFHNWKLGRLEKASAREANIAENKSRTFSAYIKMMQEVMTFSSNVETQLATNRHIIQMNELERYHKQQLVQQEMHNTKIKEQQVKQEELKTMTMDVELKTSDLTLKRMMKEMEMELDSST